MNARIPDDAMPSALNPESLQTFVDEKWDDEIVPALTEYIAVPAKSPAFDPDWAKTEYLERGVRSAAHWGEEQQVSGTTPEDGGLPCGTHVLLFARSEGGGGGKE